MGTQRGGGGGTAATDDPAALLARGFSARYLGAVLQSKGVTALTADEVDRDLRHMTAYAEAATRYHQLTYASTNRLPLHASPHGAAAATAADAVHSGAHHAAHAHPHHPHHHPAVVLPVTIDPEEEKRALQQRKRIQRAEGVREELEQHYVALRAHYVLTTQQLQQLQQESARRVQFLQEAAGTAGRALGLSRARLQMARDVRAALEYRKGRLAALAAAAAGDGGGTTDPTVLAAGADSCPMVATWTQTEDELKRVYTAKSGGAVVSITSSASGAAGGKQQDTSGSGSTGGSKKGTAPAVLPWSCTTTPATARGTPQLVSALSTVPEKSIAVSTNGAFGAQPHSLQWLERHLLYDAQNQELFAQDCDDGDEGGVVDDENNEPDGGGGNHLTHQNERLAEEVRVLQAELQKERESNQHLLKVTGQARTLHDEWVSMISLVRQETESVLHRHNILLESDEVLEAAAAAGEDEGDEEEEDGDDDVDEEDEQQGLAEEEEEDGEIAEEGTAAVTQEEPVAAGDGLSQETTTTTTSAAAPGGETTAPAVAAPPPPMDEAAADADDEGLGEEADEDDASNWNATATAATTTAKRNAAAAAAEESSDNSSPGRSSKRRKV